MDEIVKNKIVLEMCPTSSLRNTVVKNVTELKKIVKIYLENKIRFTINTDGPEMYCTDLVEEQTFLQQNGVLTKAQIDQCTEWAFESSFIR